MPTMMNVLKPNFMTLLMLIVFACAPEADSKPLPDDLFGPTSPADYLLGRFNPAHHPDFININTLQIPTGGRTIYMRAEAARAFRALHKAFTREHPEINLYVISGTRNFNSQRGIWEAKWKGSRKVGGQSLNKTIPDPLKRAYKILEYSSMPGTSRHHWGTDLDINKLTNSYYKTGNGLVLYRWMLANAARYGFCQPYTAGRNRGYHEERWHWSYKPLSSPLLKAWTQQLKNVYPDGSKFAGVGHSGKLARIYVESINPACR